MADYQSGDPFGTEIDGHSYDGIQEYDNPTPAWWHVIFFGSIMFALLYTMVVHLAPAWPTRQARFAKQEERALQLQFAELRKIPMGEEKLRIVMGSDKWLEMGRGVFKKNCVLCHGEHGEGLIGPNMTDDYYKNIKTLADFIDVISNGAAGGAMPANKTLLNENEIALVAGYEASLRGKNLSGPRGQEGEQIPPFPEPIAEGTTPSDG
ncbi:MAG: cbb3-type cytochrome c oxidase N-terminal domain-containing protein [Phycisphaerales bacterium]